MRLSRNLLFDFEILGPTVALSACLSLPQQLVEILHPHAFQFFFHFEIVAGFVFFDSGISTAVVPAFAVEKAPCFQLKSNIVGGQDDLIISCNEEKKI